MKRTTLLGGRTPAEFLRDYWHKKPLLIRQAIPDFSPPLMREALFALAARDEVESRLITHFNRRWDLRHGPFEQLPSPSKKHWTLLVQGVNLYDRAADRLLREFDFISNARLDDLMISYASDGGGVGPHFDSYDVFLLQAHGKRRWRIGKQKDLSLIEGMPLKILRDFEAQQEFVLEPGDMLYLPPHYAHDGIAQGECMTYSIGFRAPSHQELGEAFLQFMAETIELPGRYADPDLMPARRAAEIGSGMLDKVEQTLQGIRFSREDIAVFLGEYLSEPKSHVFFEPPARVPSLMRFAQIAAKRGLRLSLKTQMLHCSKHLFVNGESFTMRNAERNLLKNLADRRRLSGPEVADASADALEALYLWYRAGWLSYVDENE
jgi:50S ribosomal protein L16 3-hydroxylase